MILKYDGQNFMPVESLSIRDALGENEKKLENYLKKIIGDLIFPNYFIVGNQRRCQKEADLFALNSKGDLIVFELKVDGKYDRAKVYQAMDYAHLFSNWQYSDFNNHYKKCFPEADSELIHAFEQHFGFAIPFSDFNKKQKIIVISNESSLITHSAIDYWADNGIDIEEYFYRFYKINDNDDNLYLELSNEIIYPSLKNGVWINTCLKFIPNAFIDMIKNSQASVYGDLCGLIGEHFNKTTIFIYHNGYGIIGVGTGTAKINEREYNEDIGDYENTISLSNFLHGVNLETNEIEKYIAPSRIRELSERNLGFPTITNTKVVLTEDETQHLYKECKNIFGK